MSQNHIVFGTGPLGRATARELVRMGHSVRMVNRSGTTQSDLPGVEVVAADLYDPAQVAKVAAGAVSVYQCAQPAHYYEWDKFPPLIDAIITGVTGTGAKLISGDNLYMYGDTDGRTITEALPYAADTKKGKFRAAAANKVREAHENGMLRTAIVRASDFYGPEADLPGMLIFAPALAGAPMTALADTNQPHSFTYIADFGRALAIAGTDDRALGEDWIAPTAPAVTQRAFIQMVADELGITSPQINILDTATLTYLGQKDPTMTEMVEMAYEYEKPFVVDTSKFETTFGVQPTPLIEGVRASIAWYRAHPMAAPERG